MTVGNCVDKVDPRRHRQQSAGRVPHAGDHDQGSVGRADSVRDRCFPGVRADERTYVRDTTIAQGTGPWAQGTTRLHQ